MSFAVNYSSVILSLYDIWYNLENNYLMPMVLSPFSKATSRKGTQEIPNILLSTKVHCRVRKSLAIIPTR
jgi:hypothetical protein